jgi:hypothetical protein
MYVDCMGVGSKKNETPSKLFGREIKWTTQNTYRLKVVQRQ